MAWSSRTRCAASGVPFHTALASTASAGRSICHLLYSGYMSHSTRSYLHFSSPCDCEGAPLCGKHAGRQAAGTSEPPIAHVILSSLYASVAINQPPTIGNQSCWGRHDAGSSAVRRIPSTNAMGSTRAVRLHIQITRAHLHERKSKL